MTSDTERALWYT